MELSVVNLNKYLTELEQQTPISTPYCVTAFGPDGSDSGLSEKSYHPDYIMAASSENIAALSRQLCQPRRRYQRRHSYDLDSAADSDSLMSAENSDSELSCPVAIEDVEEGWFSGDEDGEAPREYGLIDSEVIDLGGDKIVWETHFLALQRKAGIGFGIAVSGGVDNPHFASGETSIAVSDVLKGGPAEGKLRVKDRIVSINGEGLEEACHASAIQLLQASPDTLELVIKRRVYLPSPHSRLQKSVTISKPQAKSKDLGFELGCRFYVKKMTAAGRPRAASTMSLTSPGQEMEEGDVILKINNETTESLTLHQVRKLLEKTRGEVQLTLERPPKPVPSRPNSCFYGSTDNIHSRLSAGHAPSPLPSVRRAPLSANYASTSRLNAPPSEPNVDYLTKCRQNPHAGYFLRATASAGIARARANSLGEHAARNRAGTFGEEAGRARANTVSGTTIPEERADLASNELGALPLAKSQQSSMVSLTAVGQGHARRYNKKPRRVASFSNQSCHSSPAHLYRRMKKDKPERAERVRKHSASLQYINRAFVDDDAENASQPAAGRRHGVWSLTRY